MLHPTDVPKYTYSSIANDALVGGGIDAFNYHNLDGELNVLHKIAIAMAFGLPPFGAGF